MLGGLGMLVALGVTGCGSAGRPATGTSGSDPGAGMAPDFELPTLDGAHERLAEQRGRVVLLDFWATFCEPCLLELPELDALYRRERARGLIVYGVSIDEASSAARVRTAVAKLGLSFPILLDTDTRVVSLYNPRATAPYSVLVGRDGRVLRRQEGYTTSERESLERAVDDALRR